MAREVVETVQGRDCTWEVVRTAGGPGDALYQLWDGRSMKAGPFASAEDAVAEAKRRG